MNVAPGWYDDPQRPGLERFHDGRAWTRHVRNDLPDIPLAPWADPSVPRVVDSRPPRSTRSAATAVGAGLLGIGLLTWAGASTTLEALASDEPVVAPSAQPLGDPVLPVYSCADVADTTLTMSREDADQAISQWTSPAVAVEDHQPILALPPEGEQYLVIACTAAAAFADGRTGAVEMAFTVDSAATVWVDWAES